MNLDYESVSISDKQAVGPAAQRLKEIAYDMAGLRAFAITDIERPQPMVDAEGAIIASTIFGWDKRVERQWMKPSWGAGSPVHSGCRVENRPFWVNDEGAAGVSNNPHLAAIDFSFFKDRWKVKAAIVAPVHLPFAQIGVAVFTCSDDARVDLSREHAAFGRDLQHLAQIFVSDYYSLQPRPLDVPPNVKLTARERECLTWISRGKTDEETATIMNCRRPTVRFHVQNAVAKLNATNRAHAVLRAAQFGYLPGA